MKNNSKSKTSNKSKNSKPVDKKHIHQSFVMSTENEHVIEYIIDVYEVKEGEIIEMSRADNSFWSNPGEIIASVLDDGYGYKWSISPGNDDYLNIYESYIIYKFLNQRIGNLKNISTLGNTNYSLFLNGDSYIKITEIKNG